MKPSKTNPLFARFFRSNTLVTAVVCSLGFAATASAQSISVNFGSDRGPSAITEAGKTSGAVPIAGDRWNNTTVNGGGTLANLIDSTGATTSASVTWTANNTWQSGSGGATATSENGDLTKGYLDDGGGWTVNLTSPYLLNDIYIIHATDQGNPATMSAVSVNGTFHTGDGAGGTVAVAGSGYSWSAANFSTADTLVESTNFIKVPGQLQVSLAALNSSPGRAAIAGLQVVNAYSGTLAYWDLDGTTAGAGGGTTPTGTWNATNTNWSTSALGDLATGTWAAAAAQTAVFSAGTTATGAYTVSLEGTQTAEAVWARSGTVTLADGGSGQLTLTGLGMLLGNTGLTVNVPISTASLSTVGIVTLGSTANALTGLVSIGGTTTLGSDQSFGSLGGIGTLALGTRALSVGSDNSNSGFGGLFTGSGAITKTGTGRLAILTNNTAAYTGTLTVNSGALRIGNGGTIGTLTNPVVNNATLEFLRSDSAAQNFNISGAGVVSFLGTGVSGQSDYWFSALANTVGVTGPVSVTNSRLRVNAGDFANSGTITVENGGQAWLFAGNHTRNLLLKGTGWLEPTGLLGAIRFETNANAAGTVTIDSGGARLVAYGTTGSISGPLLGAGNLEINVPTVAAANGTINLGNAGGYSGTLTLARGIVNVGASGLGGNLVVTLGTANVTGGVTGTVTNAATTTIGGTVVGNAVSNGGVLTLSGGATGNVTANAGAATVNGTIGGNLTAADGVSVAGEGTVTGTVNLGTTTGGTLRVNAATAGALTAGTLNMAGTYTVMLDTLPTAVGAFAVLKYTTLGTAGEGNFLVPAGVYRGDPAVVLDPPNKQFTLQLDSQNRTWDNHGLTGAWNTLDANWIEDDELFFSGDTVTFGNAGAGTVNLGTGLQPLSIAMTNTAGNNYTFAGGSILGSTGISLTGGGNLTLGGTNAFTGEVAVAKGVLALNSQEALGQTSGVKITAGAQVNLNGQSVGSSTNTTWTIAGNGPDGAGGLGAVINTGGDIYERSSIKYLVLSNDAEIGGNNGRFDIGRDGTTGGGGGITGGGFTLTKVGTNSMVARGPASGVTYVINAGMLTFEDYDTASGINPITVNAGTVGSYNNRTFPNDVVFTAAGNTLISQAGTATWLGGITLNGNTTFQADGNLVIEGSLAGTGNITKAGGSALVLQNSAAGYSGKVTVNGGTLRIESAAALGTATGTDVVKLGNCTLQGGTITAQASAAVGSATQGLTHTGTVYYDPGAGNTLTIGGAVTGTGDGIKNNNSGALVFSEGVNLIGRISANGGSMAFPKGLTLTRALETGGDIVTTIGGTGGSLGTDETADAGIHMWRSTLNVSHTDTLNVWDIEIQDGGGETGTLNQTSGTLNVTKDIRIGHWGNATAESFSVYNMTGGTLNQPDTVTNPAAEDQANLFLGIDGTAVLNQSGGTINTTSLVLDGRGDTLGNDTYRMTGGRLNLGKWGIRSGNAGATTLIELGGGTLGATADWTGTLPISLTGTNGNVTVNTLDSADSTTPRSITLNGALSGPGGLTKTGAGTLTLASATGTFAGVATVNGGTLFVNSGAAAAGTLKTAAGGTLQPGSLAGVGTANAGNLTLDGGAASFRIGTSTDKFVVATSLTVSSPTIIRAIPGNAISGPFPVKFDVIDYTGTIGGPIGFDDLHFVPSNPHLGGELVNDTTNTVVQVQINKADSVIWRGTSSTNWDTTTTNWVLGSDGTTPSLYYDFDVVRFDNSGLGTPTVTLGGTTTPATLAVENTSGTYTFQGGSIAGGTGLTKSGAGTLTLLTNNTNTGPVLIEGGRVNVGNGGANGVLGGTGNIPLGTGVTLAFNTTTNAVLPATRLVTGAGAVEQNGTGTLEFQGINTFSGGLTINAGTVVVSTGGEAGSVGGVVTVNGGTLSATADNAFGWGANRITTLNLNGGMVTTSANGDQGWAWAVNLTAGNLTATGAGYYSFGNSSSVNYLGTTTPAIISAPIRLREGNPGDLLPFTVNDGAAAVDLSVTGGISEQWGVRGISKLGAGTLELAGGNTFTGPLNIGSGTVRVTRPANSVIPNALTGSGTLEHNSPQELILSGDGSAFGGTIDANGKITRLVGATSGSGTGGTIALEGGTITLNPEGLLFYGTFAGGAMVTTALNTNVVSDSAAALHGGIPGDTTIAYDGEIYLTTGQWSFGENVDDAVYVNVGGSVILNDATWDGVTTGTFTAPSDGWYPITLRVQNAGGGHGPVGAWATAGIGIGIKTGGTSTNVADYTRFEFGALGTKCRALKAAGIHTMAGGITLGSGVANTIDTGDGALTVNGVIAGSASASLVKAGTGTLTLAGGNTYSGETVVDAGTLVVNGSSIVDGNKLVINGGKVEVTGTEAVSFLSYGTTPQLPGTYGSEASGATYPDNSRFSGTGVVLVLGPGYASWINGFGLVGSAQGATADPDQDGIPNLLEWVLGGVPNVSDPGIAPTLTTTGGNLVLHFKRADRSEVDTTVKGQWSTDLTSASWNDIAPVLVSENADAPDDMTVSVPLSNAVDGKLFIRLSATK